MLPDHRDPWLSRAQDQDLTFLSRAFYLNSAIPPRLKGMGASRDFGKSPLEFQDFAL